MSKKSGYQGATELQAGSSSTILHLPSLHLPSALTRANAGCMRAHASLPSWKIAGSVPRLRSGEEIVDHDDGQESGTDSLNGSCTKTPLLKNDAATVMIRIEYKKA